LERRDVRVVTPCHLPGDGRRRAVLAADDRAFSWLSPMPRSALNVRHTVTIDQEAIQYVAQARNWFDSVWNTIAREQTG